MRQMNNRMLVKLDIISYSGKNTLKENVRSVTLGDKVGIVLEVSLEL